MTAEPPEAGPPSDGPSASAGPSATAEERRTSPVGPRRLALVVGLLIGAVTAAILLLNSDDPEQPPAPEAQRGVVCPYLRDASEQLEAGNETAFVEAVNIAAREAELSLERSGQLFGRPEELALELHSMVAREAASQDIQDLMVTARGACKELGRWTPHS